MYYYGAPYGNFGFSSQQHSATFHGPYISHRADTGAGRKELIGKLILDIGDEDQRESALAQLSKLSEQSPELFRELGPLLWFSFGTIAVLVKEIVSVYELLSPPTLTSAQLDRVCNVILLLRCVAYHPDTRTAFLRSYIPMYLVPFLETNWGEKQLELLRPFSLEVIGRLVETSESKAIAFLFEFEVMPLVLKAMNEGSGWSKTMATFILLKIILDDTGLNYLCSAPDKMCTVVVALNNMVAALVEQPSFDGFKFTVACYWLLSENEEGLEMLAYDLPRKLCDGTFNGYQYRDPVVSHWLNLLQENVQRFQLQCNVE